MNLIEGLDIEYINVHDSELDAKMNLSSFHSQPFGLLHGGATIAFAETVSSHASNLIIDSEQGAVGQTIVAHHMKSKLAEGYVIAKGTLMHKGKKTHVWGLEICDENDVLISYVTATNAIINFGTNKLNLIK